jgi:lipid-binding SYLF domain-containing protein
MIRNSWIVKGAAIGIAAGFGVGAFALNRAEVNANVDSALIRFNSESANHRELIDKASAVLVFPQVTKAGAVVGGEYGVGALEINGKTVGYYKVTGASVGATIGVAQRSEVVLFMTDEARDKFMASRNWTIGADTGVALIKGASYELDNENLKKPVLAFVFDEGGLIADVSLEGAKISKVPHK